MKGKKAHYNSFKEKLILWKREISFFFYNIYIFICRFFKSITEKVCKFFKIKNRNARMGSYKVKEKVFIYGMLLVPIIHFLIFYIYVNLDSFTLAFKNSIGGREYWTLNNFAEIIRLFGREGSIMRESARNTLIFWVVGAVMGIPHSILLTYVFHKKIRGFKFYRVALFVPSMISAVALAGIFSNFISQSGALGKIMLFFGAERVPDWFMEEEYAMFGLVIYNIFFGFAGNYMLLGGAMARIPQEVWESAMMDGAKMKDDLIHLVIPLTFPTLSMLLIGLITGIFGASGNILVLTQGQAGTFTFAYWIFDQVRSYNSYYIPSALGLIFSVFMFPIVVFLRYLFNKITEGVEF